jgi:hypothetical protein
MTPEKVWPILFLPVGKGVLNNEWVREAIHKKRASSENGRSRSQFSSVTG